MQISDSLEVGIGLSFIFFLSSLVLASIHELIEIVLKARGANLFNGIVEMLHDPKIVDSGEQAAKTLYQHPLIRSLMRGDVSQPGFEKNLPSYLPTQSVALALIDHTLQGRLSKLTAPASTPVSLLPVQRLRIAAEGIESAQLRGAVIHAIDTADDDLDTLRTNLETWFDSAMDRVSGWYKRRSQRIIFGLGLAMAVLLNVNTLTIANSLFDSATLRRGLVTVIEKGEQHCVDANSCASASPALGELERSNIPIGWTPTATSTVLAPISRGGNLLQQAFGVGQILAGYLLTAFAVTLGAPFWFDVLNRLMVIRATVKPNEKSQTEASQDPQPHTGESVAVSIVRKPTDPPHASGIVDKDVYAMIPEMADRLFEDDAGAAISGAGPPPSAPTPPATGATALPQKEEGQ